MDRSDGTKITVRRRGDRRSATMRFLGPGFPDPSIGFGPRGACVRINARVFLWDKSTGRIWRRTTPMVGQYLGGEVACPGAVVATETGDATGRPGSIAIEPRPTVRAPRGWKALARLRPGTVRVLRAGPRPPQP